MKTIYLVRGLPGSGKTTVARQLTDNYVYDHRYIKDAHQYCQALVETFMNESRGTIAVANTFTRKWEMAAYHTLARTYGYTVVELTVNPNLSFEELAQRNVHGVPENIIHGRTVGELNGSKASRDC